MAQLSAEEFRQIMRDSLPFATQLGAELIELTHARAVLRMPYRSDFLRPGGTISGPVLMGLADLAMYGVVLAAIGRVELAVTTNLTINFLRKPGPADLIAEARLLKLGKRLAVGEVELFSAGESEMVAHVTATYSIPPAGEHRVL
jgi:uncharacterized protein (TIGR00369 family)